MRAIAPAKINWTLEVLGRRPDGYHEIRSILQTIDFCDELWFEELDDISLETEGGDVPADDQLVTRAALLLRDRTGTVRGCRIRLRKRIPVAAGLGGGSSDAAATLRALDRLWDLHAGPERLAEWAAELGSDVPFFVRGGAAALTEGRGERVTPLPDAPPLCLVLLTPPLSVPDKTARMYQSLRPEDFTDGLQTDALAGRLRKGGPLSDGDLYNAFELPAAGVFPSLGSYRTLLEHAGARSVHLAGAGPSLFALAQEEAEARDIASRLGDTDAVVHVVRTLGLSG